MAVLKNPKHELFAQALAKGTTLEDAHRKAGYKASRSGASQLKQKLHISARITELLAEREEIHAQSTAKAVERVSLTKEWVLAKLIDNAERALQHAQALDREGKPIGDFKYEGSVANRALELLGKELGMFIDRKEVRNVSEFDEIEDADTLRQRLIERATEAGAGDLAAALAGGAGAAGRKLN